ncbi:MAG TPA: hypothetical protein VMN03_04130 [Burkholderiales bacterium]|nr:hypothetical protein [Burkholderiales bacterium]
MYDQTVKSPNTNAPPHQLHTNNTVHAPAAPTDDSYARGSFTMRGMQPWQIWTLAIVAVVAVVLGWLYI